MYNPTPHWQQQGSYLEPVAIPAAHPGDAPLVCVRINTSWIPYCLGSLQQLAQPTTWVDTGGSSVQDALNDVQDLLDTVGAAGPCSDAVCGLANGLDNYLSAGPSSDFDFSAGGGFSAWAWVWCAKDGALVSQDRNTSGGSGWYLEAFAAAGVRQVLGGVNNGPSAVNDFAGALYFGMVAVTYDVSHLRIFYNGTLLQTTVATINPAFNIGQPLQIGRQGTGTYFGGLIRDVQVYAGRVPDADIASIAAAGGGTSGGATLKAWWKMDEGAGTTAADSSGNGHTATWHGTGPYWGTWPA